MKTIILSKGQQCLVDDDDYNRFCYFNWYLNENGYVLTDIPKWKQTLPCKVRLHRLIAGLGPDDKLDVDHKNGDKLDNRKENLRICTRQENLFNKKGATTKYKGAYYDKRKDKWFSSITYYNEQGIRKNKFLGYYDTPEQCAEVFKNAAEIRHKEFAYHKREKKNEN